MSLKGMTFYAIQCDFPDCGDVYEGDDYQYYAEPYYQRDGAAEIGWLLLDDGDYCPTHVIQIEHPAEDMRRVGGDTYCGPCEDRGADEHLIPMPDTIANRLAVVEERVVRRAHQKLKRVERDMVEKFDGHHGSLKWRTELALREIHDAACLRFDPTLTRQQLFELHHPKQRSLTDGPVVA